MVGKGLRQGRRLKGGGELRVGVIRHQLSQFACEKLKLINGGRLDIAVTRGPRFTVAQHFDNRRATWVNNRRDNHLASDAGEGHAVAAIRLQT